MDETSRVLICPSSLELIWNPLRYAHQKEGRNMDTCLRFHLLGRVHGGFRIRCAVVVHGVSRSVIVDIKAPSSSEAPTARTETLKLVNLVGRIDIPEFVGDFPEAGWSCRPMHIKVPVTHDLASKHLIATGYYKGNLTCRTRCPRHHEQIGARQSGCLRFANALRHGIPTMKSTSLHLGV